MRCLRPPLHQPGPLPKPEAASSACFLRNVTPERTQRASRSGWAWEGRRPPEAQGSVLGEAQEGEVTGQTFSTKCRGHTETWWGEDRRRRRAAVTQGFSRSWPLPSVCASVVPSYCERGTMFPASSSVPRPGPCSPLPDTGSLFPPPLGSGLHDLLYLMGQQQARYRQRLAQS